MPMQVDITVRLPLSEIQRLRGPQCRAMLDGVAQVIAALPRLPGEPAAPAAVDPPADSHTGTPSTRV